MKKSLITLFLLLFIVHLATSQSTTRYFFYDDAGNRIWRKDHLGVDPNQCPTSIAGYTKLGEYNNHAYFMSDNPAKWVDAKILAENENGYLATMNDQAENDWLKIQLGNEMVFIGYNDATTEGTMQWANNEPVTLNLGYSNSAGNDYGLMNFWAGTWQLVGPWQSRKFILEYDCTGNDNPTGDLTITCPANINATTTSSSTPVSWNPPIATTTCSVNTDVTITQTTGGSSGANYPIGTTTISYQATDNCNNTENCSFTITVTAAQGGGCGNIAGFTKLGEFGGHGYYMSNASAKWTQAKTLAQNAGGYLATMNSQAENDFLKSKLNNNMVFIGFNDAASEGTGQWANNEPVTLDLSYDNNASNDYAVMNFWAGTWQMVNQWVSKKYIVELNCSGPPAPQPVPKTAPVTDIVLFPNPNDGIFKIQANDDISKEAKVYIYDSHGVLTYTRNYGDGSFDISDLPTGTYWVLLQDGHQRYKLNVVKGD